MQRSSRKYTSSASYGNQKKEKIKDIPAKQAYINQNPKSSYQYLFSNSQSHDLKYVRNMVQKLDRLLRTNSQTQNDLLGFADEDDLAFAKSTRSLKRASSCFTCFVGVDELRERF